MEQGLNWSRHMVVAPRLYAEASLTLDGGAKYLRWKNNATFTRLISTGTSTSGPITAANAARAQRRRCPTLS